MPLMGIGMCGPKGHGFHHFGDKWGIDLGYFGLKIGYGFAL